MTHDGFKLIHTKLVAIYNLGIDAFAMAEAYEVVRKEYNFEWHQYDLRLREESRRHAAVHGIEL